MVLIFITTPLSVALSGVGLFTDIRKRWAIMGMCIGGAMALLIGGSFIVALVARH